MLTRAVVNTVKSTGSVLGREFRRNIGVTAAMMQVKPKVEIKDAIHQLFLDKVRDYSMKSRSAGGKMIDATPELLKRMSDDLAKIDSNYAVQKDEDMTSFPTFEFKDRMLDPVGVKVEIKDDEVAPEMETELEEDNNKHYWEI